MIRNYLWILPLLFVGLLAGCAKPKLYGPAVDVSKYVKNNELRIAIINGFANKKYKGGVRNLLADRLESYIQSDISTKQNAYKSLAQSQEIPIPANMKPAPIVFVDRSSLESILQEQDFGETDRVDPNTAAQMGKISGAQALLIVKVDIQKSNAKQQALYKRVRKERWVRETRINSKGKRVLTQAGARKKNPKMVKQVYYVRVPVTVGGKQKMVTTQLVRVKGNVKLVETATSRVIYAKVTDSQTYRVSATYVQGSKIPKLKLGSAALESLKSLGHKIGRLFYPIVVRGGLLADNSDPRTKSSDPLGPDMTWD